MKKVKLILLLAIVFASGCLTDAEQARSDKHSLREWKETSRGVRYFHDCVEGLLFIATPSTHGNTQLAGPIGSCDVPNL